MREMPSKSRKVVVVKSLKDLSPRKSLLVSRAPQGEHETSQKLGSKKSNFGNHSPSVSVAVAAILEVKRYFGVHLHIG